MNKLKNLDYGMIVYFATMFITILFGTRFFGTNDDMLMMLFVSGIYTGEPSEFITFQNIIIGQVLKQFYLFSPNTNWYVGFLSSVQVISFTALYFLLKPLSDKTLNFFLFVLPLLYFIVEVNLYLQFTKVAFLSSTVGILYGINYFIKPKNSYLVLSALFIILGLLVREHSAYGTVLLALPVLIFIALKYRQNINYKYFIMFIILMLSITYFLKAYNTMYYKSSSPGWKTYTELISIRGAIYYNRTITKECFKEEGHLSYNDVQSFYKWTNDSKQVFTPEKLEHVFASCSKDFFKQNEKIFHQKHLKNFFNKLTSFSSLYLLIFSLLFLYIFNKRHTIYFALFLVYLILILFFVSTMTFDNRVVSSLISEFYLLVLFTFFLTKKQQYILKNKNILISITTLFLLISYVNIYSGTVYKKTPYQLNKELDFLKGNYVIISKSRNFFNQLPFDTNFSSMFQNTAFYYIGWNLGSPDNIKVLNGDDNFYELLLHKQNVVLYTDAHRLPVVKIFFLEHYNKNVDFLKLKDNYYKIAISNLDKNN